MAEELKVRISVDTQQASSALASFKHTLGGLGDVLKTGLAVGLGAGAGLIGLSTIVAKTGIDFLAMKENAAVAFTTILGDGKLATKLMEDLQRFAAQTPFEFGELAAASKSLLAFGVAGDEVVETLQRIGDISSGVSAPIGEIAELYGKAKVQGRLFAQDINQLTGRGIPIIQELAKQFGVTDDKVKGLVEEGKVGFPQLEKAFISLTSEGGKFTGMMDAQSRTFEGMMSTLKDGIAQVSGQLAAPLFDLAKEGVAGLNEFLASPEAQAGIAAFAGALKTGIENARIFLGNLKDDFAAMVEDFKAAGVEGVLGGLSEKGFGDQVAQIDALKQKLDEALAGMADIIKKHQPEIDKGMSQLASAWNELMAAIDRTWVVGSAFKRLLGETKVELPTLEQVFEEFVKGWEDSSRQLAGAIETITGWISGLTQTIWEAIRALEILFNMQGGGGGGGGGNGGGGGGGGSGGSHEFFDTNGGLGGGMGGGIGGTTGTGLGGTTVIHLTYAPVVSLMDQSEAQEKLAPFLRAALAAV